jgi:hypothetical protein
MAVMLAVSWDTLVPAPPDFFLRTTLRVHAFSLGLGEGVSARAL